MDFSALFGSGLAGSALGGLLRLAPEAFKLWDRKNEREHELKMHAQMVELEKTKGSIKMDELGAQRNLAVDTGVMAALKSVIDQQTELASKAGGFWLKASAAIRPAITALLWAIYCAGLTTIVVLMIREAVPARDIVKVVLNQDFMALLSGVTNFWFLDRVLRNRGLA